MAYDKLKNNNIDMTTGPLTKKILAFFMPLLFTNIIARLFHSVDVAVLGIFGGTNDLAAVGGGAGQINSFVLDFISGFAIGVNILISQLMGAQKYKTVSKAIHNTMFFALYGGIIMSFFGFFIATPALKILGTPEEILAPASLYLKINFIADPFNLISGLGSTILRAKGDSKTPMFASCLTSALKIVLNFIFVGVFKLGIVGTALVTLISFIINSGIVFYALIKDPNEELRFFFSKMKPDKFIIGRIITLGFPSAAYGLVLPFSNLSMSWTFNVLGPEVMAAASIASTFETIAFCVTASFTATLVTFIAQNYGAGKLERCKKTLYIALFYSVIFTYLLDFIIIFFNKYTLGMMTQDTAVINYATKRLIYVYGGHFLLIAIDLFGSALRGYGYTFLPSMSSMIGICGFRILWVFTIFANSKTYDSLLPVYPISFFITALINIIYYYIKIKEIESKIKLKNAAHS